MITLLTRGYVAPTVVTVVVTIAPNAAVPSGVTAIIDLPPVPPTGTGVVVT